VFERRVALALEQMFVSLLESFEHLL